MVSAGDGLVMGNRMERLYIYQEGVYRCELLFTFLLIFS
jgi:hypothetical protein